MKRFTDFFKSKGFYIALGTGALAFVGLLALYNYNSTKKEMLGEQAIDLNQPAELDDVSEADVAELDTNDEVKPDDENVAEAGSDSALADTDKTEETAGDTDAEGITDVGANEAVADETDVPVISNAAGAETNPAIEVGLEYDGEQTLSWPLIGNVILPYSMDTTVYYATLQSYKCNPGMLIAGDEGSDVFAAYEGVVKSVEDTKQYGTVVRVDMGNGYEAMYGQLMNVCVKAGDSVSKAQVIGEIAPVSTYYTEEGNHLYFEITKDGEPVNPVTLIQ